MVKRLSSISSKYLVLALFAILLVVRVIGACSRTELHADEIFSVMLAQCNHSYVNPLPKDTVLTGEQLKQFLNCDHTLGEDLSSLYVNNMDVPHASLYYMALRVALTGASTFDVAGVGLRGGLLNIIFFVVAFYAMWRLCLLLFGRFRYGTLISLAVLVAAFATPVSISNTLLVREYQMAEMFVCLTAWASAIIVSRWLGGKSASFKLWLAYSAAIAGALSTGYLNAVFIALISLSLFILAFVCRMKREIQYVILAPVCGLLFAALLYHGFFNFLLQPSVHTERAFSGFNGVLSIVFYNVFTFYGIGWVGVGAIVASLLLVLCGKSRRVLVETEIQWWLPLIAIITMVLVEYASLLRADRYIYPFYSVGMLLVGVVLCGLSDNLKAVFSVFLSVFILVTMLIKPVRPAYGWNFISSKLKDGAVFYCMNPNELPQIAPVLNDTAKYHLVSSPESLSRTYPPVMALTDSVDTEKTYAGTTCTLPLVARIQPPLGSLPKPLRLTGPLKIYTVPADTIRPLAAPTL